MKNFLLPLSAAFALVLSPVSVHADIFEEPEDQIYRENLNNLEQLRLSTFGGIHGQNRNYADDLNFLEMTMRELQKKHKDDKELQNLLNEVKKTIQPAVRVYKKKDWIVIHGSCKKDQCAFLGHFIYGEQNNNETYPVNEVIKQLDPQIQKADFRRRKKLEAEGMSKLQDYAGKLSAFDKACKKLEKYVRHLTPDMSRLP